jgi:hypothetical protein
MTGTDKLKNRESRHEVHTYQAAMGRARDRAGSDHCVQRDEWRAELFTPGLPYPALPRYMGVGDRIKASSFVCVADRDHDDNQPPAPKYLDDGDNYPIVPIDDRDRGHEHDRDSG